MTRHPRSDRGSAGRPARWSRPPALRAAAALSLLAALACAKPPPPEPPPPPEAAPLLWSAAQSGRGELFLLGSVHLGAQAPTFGPEVECAWEESDELVIEVNLAEVSDRDLVILATRYGRLPPSQRLSEQLTPETAALLEAYLDRRAEALAAHGFTRLVFEAMKPWFAAITVAAFEMQSAGYAAELGVDRTLLDRAGDIKPVRGLETASAQFAMLEGLSLEVQDLMLRDGLERAEGIQQQAEGLFDAWSRGDADALEQLLFAPLRDDPRLEPFYESVFFARNEAMAAALAEWSMDRRTRLVVLGAGHMVGDRSVPARLAARGFRVSRVRAAPQPDDPSRAKNCSSSLGGPAAMPASIRVFGWL